MVARAVELHGTIELLPEVGLAGAWQVGGRVPRLTAATRIDRADGEVALGALVEVEGTLLADGSISATESRLRTKPRSNLAQASRG